MSTVLGSRLDSPSKMAGMDPGDQTRPERQRVTSTEGSSRQSNRSETSLATVAKASRKASAAVLGSSAAASSALSSSSSARETSGQSRVRASAFRLQPAVEGEDEAA